MRATFLTAARHPLLRASIASLLFVGLAGADTTIRFVEALRASGHGDLVPEYLDRAADDPLVSDEFKARIPIERVATQVALANEIRQPKERLAALEASLPELREVAEADPVAGRLLTDSLDRLATAAADVGHRAAVAARRLPEGDAQQDAFIEARQAVNSARANLEEAEQRIVAEREGLKGVDPDSDEGQRRQDLGIRLGAVRLLRARLLADLAETYPEESDDYQRILTDAAEQLGELYTKYSKLGVGLYAHLYEGRSYRLLGEQQLSLAALEDLTAQPAGAPGIRRIVTLAHAERAALLREIGKADEALENPVQWLEDLSLAERKGTEAAMLKYQVALAALAQADEATDNNQRRLKQQARDWLRESSRIPSEVQAEARERWAEVTASLGIDNRTPESFVDAFQAGADAIQAMLALDDAIKSATADQREQLANQREANREAAYQALEAATRLASDKTDPEQASRARYQLAWLDWEKGDIDEAAVKAAYVARQDADTASGKEAAELALAAYERLQRDGKAEASTKLTELVDYVTQQWPNSDVARSAVAVRVSQALRSGDFEKAEGVLSSVPANQRPKLALRIAVAKWEKNKADPQLRPAALEQMQAAFDDASAEQAPGPFVVTAALYLAEAALDSGQATNAEQLLNHPDYGPATRARAAAAPADNPIFALTAYKANLRAAALAGGKVSGTIERIETLLAEAPVEKTGGERAWLGVAVALYGDLDRTEDANASSAAEALSAVLSQLDAVEESGDWNTRLWIAQARLRCGETLRDSTAAEKNVAAARDAFVGLIERAEREPTFAPTETSILAARLKLAECSRELGDYSEAVETLTKMLSSRSTLLDVQRVAAETLQDWGSESKNPERLKEAIAGTKPGADGKNVIWGWSKLAKVAARYMASNPKQRDLYFEAWRNVAASRYQSALLASGADRKEQLRQAAATLQAVQRQNPELGGQASQQAFAKLRQQIKSAQGGGK